MTPDPESASASASDAEFPEHPHHPPRRFGLVTATYMIVSSMIGVGVMTTSGYTVLAVGSNQYMVALWFVGGALALCGALAQAELAAALPHSGGDYVFIREAYGQRVGFVVGWISILFGFGMPLAVSAMTCAGYWLAPAFSDGAGTVPDELYVKGLATALLLVLCLPHFLGHGGTARWQGLATTATLLLLILFVAAGLARGADRAQNLADAKPFTASLVVQMLFSLMYVSYAYAGWNSAAYVAGEVRDPARNLPRAILGGTLLVSLLYVAINLVYALALPAPAIIALGTENPSAVRPIAELAARELFGPGPAAWLSYGIALVLVAMLSAFLVTGPRVVVAMSRAGHFFRWAGKTTPRGHAPIVATILLVAFALLGVWIPRFNDALVFAGFGLAVGSLLSVAAVYVLRVKRPDMPRPYRVPGYPLVPAVYLVGTAALTLAAAYERPLVALASIVGMAVGFPLYGLLPRTAERAS